MLKKLLIVVMCIALLSFIGVGCKTEAAPAEEAVEEADDGIIGDLAGTKIGFVNAGPDDYYAVLGNGLKGIGELYGFEFTELNSDYKPEKELSNVQDLIAKGVDAIVVITAGAAGSAATIDAANAADVPIFFIAGKPAINEGGKLTGHVTDNFVIMGYGVGKWAVDNVENPVAVNIPGFLGQGPAEGEIVGFNLAFAEAGLEEPFLTASSEWQRTLAIPITQDLVASGREFNVLFACNEETAAGVLTVFEEQNVEGVTIVSANGKEEGWAWLESGQMSATAPNPPPLNGDLCIQQIVRYLNGEDFIEGLQIMPWDVLTKENLDKAIPWVMEDYLEGRENNEFEWDLAFYEKAYTDNADSFVEFDEMLNDYLANN